LESFRDEFPDRFINAGVAEQNMTGLATGLALSGKIVFTYSIANFPTLRCLEQVRNDVCYHQANVKIVSIGGGYAYGPHGYTHHGVEDYGIVSLIPNMTVIAPGDPIETERATELVASLPGPCYLRLGRSNEPVFHPENTQLAYGKALVVREGTDGTIISTGAVLGMALAAADQLAASGLKAAVISMPFLCPLDRSAILTWAGKTGSLVVVEEHGPGGLGTMVAEVLATSNVSAKLSLIRSPREVINVAGKRDYLCAKQGISSEAIVSAFCAALPNHAVS
jgi:transketolase